jgi:putative oxidoreductase
MADLTLLPEETRPRINLADLMIRLGVAIVFLIAGAEKVTATNPNSHWVSMFNQIGLGDWFRYFTAVVEVVGAALILIPRTVLIGVALLAVTMASAAVIVFVVLGQPGESLFPALIFVGLIALGWKHWNK